MQNVVPGEKILGKKDDARQASSQISLQTPCMPVKYGLDIKKSR